MPRLPQHPLSRYAIAAYVSICVALALLLMLTVWGSYRDLRFLRSTLLQAEVDKVRSDAIRTAGRIERDLEAANSPSLESIRTSDWLREHWKRVLSRSEQRLYAALVDTNGVVVMHSNPSQIGQRLRRGWYDRTAFNVAEGVFETRSEVLTGGQAAYDIRVPVLWHGTEAAEYHVGLDLNQFQSWLEHKEDSFLRRRALLIGGVSLVVLLATTSLYFIAAHSLALRQAVSDAYVERAKEVSTLAAGLAHEIRNPLHAIRLNLHTFRRFQDDDRRLPPEEVGRMLDESSREIERIDRLMQELLGFAAPEEPREELIDLKAELQAIVDFIHQEMLRKQINLQMHLPPEPVTVRIDSARLRQIMLNLIQNAQQAVRERGTIEVALAMRGGIAEITVTDTATGISDEERTRVFEPFFSTKSGSSGLGLAVVKRFVDEVGGEISCEKHASGGTSFRILLKESAPQDKKKKGR